MNYTIENNSLQGQGKEAVKSVALTALILGTVSLFAFTFRARREILKRDGGVCQCGCGRSWENKYHFQMAHYPELHQKGWDDNPDNGRVLATECHIIEELRRGNDWGARKLWESQTVMNYDWIEEHGYDTKLPFEDYIQMALEEPLVA